jgi:predicted metalloprotease with PDZ domain
VVGLLLDLEIRRRSQGKKSLDDVMRLLYERHGRAPGLPEDGIERAIVEIGGPELQPWLDRALRSTDELDVEGALAGVGLSALWHPAEGADDKGSAESDPDEFPETISKRGYHGAQIREAGGVLSVQSVIEGSPAQAAGLANGDDIAAIDGHRGELKSRFNKAAPGSLLRLTVFRGDELVEVRLTVASWPADTLTIVPMPNATQQQLALRRAWLGGEWPEPEERRTLGA